jgi:hypothetical protein
MLKDFLPRSVVRRTLRFNVAPKSQDAAGDQDAGGKQHH